ncbi:class I SAM-dependent methyltransferase [Gemmatimonadota bacterium]
MTLPCPFCSAEREYNGVLPPDRMVSDAPGTRLIVCSGCGTLESDIPDPPSISTGTSTHYFPHEHPTGLKGWLAQKSQQRKASLTLPWSPDGDVVDLGCGSGGFLDAWRIARTGSRAVGLESVTEAIDVARKRGLEIVEGDLDGPLPGSLHGVILYTMWHVLEHLDDPGEVLRSIRGIMKPTGRIVIVVPNAAGFERSIFGKRTIAWDPPRHRWHFTPEGLTALARNTGLHVVDRFNLVSDDVYDAVASLQWALHPDFWIDSGSIRSTITMGMAVMWGVPIGLMLATLSPWRQRASLGVILAPDD